MRSRLQMRDILSITHGNFDVWADGAKGSVYAGVTPIAIPREYKSSKGGIASKAQNSIVGNNLNKDKNK